MHLLSPQQFALFLSIKYHNSYPTYTYKRITEIQLDYDLQILLYLVAVENNSKLSLVLNKIAVMNNMKLVLAWTEEETARYLETFKALDIQKREINNYVEQVHHVLCNSHSKVNKIDTAQILSQFGSVKQVITASVEE